MNTPNAEATTTDKAAAVAEQGAQVAPEKPASKKDATKKKGAPKGQKAAKGGKAKADKPKKRPNEKVTSKKGAKVKEAAVPREFSKKSIVLDLLRRPKGATIAEIAKATNWQNHSIRGFISGSLGKKMGLTVSSVKREDGERVYTIAK